MRWPPVILTIGTLYFSATSAMRRSSAARRDAAEDARHHAERAVLLDVGVHAVVDEPRVALVVVVLAPDRACSSEARPALLAGILVSARQLGEHRRHAAQAALPHGLDELRLARAARRARSSARTGPPAPSRRPRARAPAGPAACTRRSRVPARVASHSDLRRAVARLHRRDERALRHAVAVADLRRARAGRRCSARSRRRRAGRAARPDSPAARFPGRTLAVASAPTRASPRRIAPPSRPSRTMSFL